MKASRTARMHNPPHPGEVLRDTVLGADALTVCEFARALRVSRVARSRVVNGRAAVSADMALRFADALGGSAESWLRLQASYDLWQASRKPRPKIALIKVRH
jgi:addiction module HigA family antidote